MPPSIQPQSPLIREEPSFLSPKHCDSMRPHEAPATTRTRLLDGCGLDGLALSDWRGLSSSLLPTVPCTPPLPPYRSTSSLASTHFYHFLCSLDPTARFVSIPIPTQRLCISRIMLLLPTGYKSDAFLPLKHISRFNY